MLYAKDPPAIGRTFQNEHVESSERCLRGGTLLIEMKKNVHRACGNLKRVLKRLCEPKT